MLEVSENYFKATVIKMFQQTIHTKFLFKNLSGTERYVKICNDCAFVIIDNS